jgi:RNA polymerase-binding transcription factor DksA
MKRHLAPIAGLIDKRERELRRQIAEERQRVEAEGFSQLAESAVDAADHAFARVQVGLESELIDRHLAEIRDLEAARKRLADDTFGTCVDCGEDIDPARLAATPAALRCAACQARQEATRALRDGG